MSKKEKPQLWLANQNKPSHRNSKAPGANESLEAAPHDMPPRIAFSAAGSTAVSPAEKSIADMHRLIRQRGADSEREINAILQEIVGCGKPPSAFLDKRIAATPLEQAQDIMYEAFEANGHKRLKLARRALAISPDCADAYVLLADEEDSAAAANDLYQQGVQAGERALKSLFGEEVFDEDAGEFWGILETRPYMRALAGLAETLWYLGEHEESIKCQQQLLHLNPNDNQGIRYILIGNLLEEGRDKEADALLRRYSGDVTAAWAYSRALWNFRNKKRSVADRSLMEAFASNPHVPVLVTGLAELPHDMPDYIEPGAESEAVDYILHNSSAWAASVGAMDWLVEKFIQNVQEFAEQEGLPLFEEDEE